MTNPGWQRLLDRIASETDPVLRRNLEVVARHVVEEVAGNLPALMATLVDEPRYEVWGASSSVGPNGAGEVLDWYQRLVASGRNRLDYRIVRVVVDAQAVVTEGEFDYAFAGHTLADVQRTEAGEPIRPAGWYLVSHRTLIVWPISGDGLIEGEVMYAGERHRVIRELDAAERPDLGARDRAG